MKVGWANGCFDLLHVGHLAFINEARSLCDSLVVFVNSDSSVRALKGNRRPIIPEDQRVEMVGALPAVNSVFLFSESTPVPLWDRIPHAPSLYFCREGALLEGSKEIDWCNLRGVPVVEIPRILDASTSNIIKRILQK